MPGSWSEVGEEIRSEVMRAVSTGDYSSLNETVRNSIHKVLEPVGGGTDYMGSYRRESGAAQQAGNARYGAYANAGQARGGQYTNGRTAGAYRSAQSGQYGRPAGTYGAAQTAAGAARQAMQPVQPYDAGRYALVTARRFRRGGTAMQVVGAVLAVPALLSAGIVGMAGLFGGLGAAAVGITMSVLLPLVTGGAALFAAGTARKKTESRFRQYLNYFKDRSYCAVKTLAGAVGKTARFVKRDLQRMIARGWFCEGFLDDQGTTMITDRQTYEQYRIAMDEHRRREALAAQQTQQEREEAERAANRSEIDRVLDEGERYIRQIRDCNDRIPGEEISEKIAQIERTVFRIYQRVQDHPEQAGELRRMQEYYLPTTVKLLEAYADMDAQEVQGENIRAAKHEIEETLETINTAYETLLDGLFRNAAWDVSTDISVLQTMFAQDGLTGDGAARRSE